MELSTRERQIESARTFLTTGDPEGDGTPPPYGREWNRDYNPLPYPEARPLDKETYAGTRVGALYGYFGESGAFGHEHLGELAGWTLVRTGAEVRR